MTRYHYSAGEKAFRAINYLFLLALALVTLYPFWYIVQASFSDPLYRRSLFWPKGFFYGNYWTVFKTEGIARAYLVTVLRVALAVPLMLTVTGCAAFALTRKELKGRKAIIFYYFITMFVSGGLVPYYMLLKTIGLLDTFWVFVIPTVFSVWTMMAMETSHDENVLSGITGRVGGGRIDRWGQLRQDLLPDHSAALGPDDHNLGAVSGRVALE